jgi:hypothetical protein
MALPKTIRPEYNLTIPSTGKRIKFMPFSVREEKILILAAESQDQDEISNAIRNTLERCVTTPGFNVDELALFDIEYLFLKCRAKSAGETIKVIVQDPADAGFQVEHEINIDTIKVKKEKDHTDLLDVDDKTKVKMKYPDLSFFEEGINMANVEAMAGAISRCILQIIVGDEVYSRADMSDEELDEWVEGLTQSQYQVVLDFFRTMPKLTHSFKLKNTNTGKDFTIVLEGLADFF